MPYPRRGVNLLSGKKRKFGKKVPKEREVFPIPEYQD